MLRTALALLLGQGGASGIPCNKTHARAVSVFLHGTAALVFAEESTLTVIRLDALLALLLLGGGLVLELEGLGHQPGLPLAVLADKGGLVLAGIQLGEVDGDGADVPALGALGVCPCHKVCRVGVAGVRGPDTNPRRITAARGVGGKVVDGDLGGRHPLGANLVFASVHLAAAEGRFAQGRLQGAQQEHGSAW